MVSIFGNERLMRSGGSQTNWEGEKPLNASDVNIFIA